MRVSPARFQGYHSVSFKTPLENVGLPYDSPGGLVIPHADGFELLLKDEFETPATLGHFVDSLECLDGKDVTLRTHQTVPIGENMLERLSGILKSVVHFFDNEKLPVNSVEELQANIRSQLEEFHRYPAVFPPIFDIPGESSES